MLEKAWVPSYILLIGNSVLALLEFTLSEQTSQVYWLHNFPDVLCPVFFSQRQDQAAFMTRLRRAPKFVQCVCAVISNWVAGTFIGALILAGCGQVGLPTYHLSLALMTWEVFCSGVLLAQCAGFVPIEWRGILLLHALMYSAVVVVVECFLFDLIYSDMPWF